MIEYKQLKPGLMFRASTYLLSYNKSHGHMVYVVPGDLLFVVDIRDKDDTATTVDMLTKHGDLVYFWCNRWLLERLDQV